MTDRPADGWRNRDTGAKPTPDLHPNGVNHLAISTADMKAQLTFFAEVLGCPTRALYWMHGVAEHVPRVRRTRRRQLHRVRAGARQPDRAGVGRHPFRQRRRSGHRRHDAARGVQRRLDRRRPDHARPHPQPRHPGARPARPRHDPVDLLRRPRGPQPRGVHRAATSTSASGSTPRSRSLCGISAEELARLTDPAGFERPDEPVAQPSYDESLPNMHYPAPVREFLMGHARRRRLDESQRVDTARRIPAETNRMVRRRAGTSRRNRAGQDAERARRFVSEITGKTASTIGSYCSWMFDQS